MKTIFKNVIESGNYDLAELLAKIDAYHIEGKLSDADRDELYALARATPDMQLDLKEEIKRLWAEVKALKKNGTSGGTTDTVKDWKQPTGAHDAYMTGDKIKFTDGKTYRSLIDYNVWSPAVYPAAWEVVK